MTTANKITIFRILLIPVFIVQFIYYARTGTEGYRLAAVLAFLTAAISDGIDGYIARRYKQRSELGALLDPIADKLLLVCGLVLVSLDNAPYLDRVPIWLAATAISRDLLLLLGWIVIHVTGGRLAVRPHPLGKVATVLQMITIVWVLLKWPVAWLFYWALAAVIPTGISGLIYLVAWVRQLGSHPASGPSGEQ